MSSFKTALCALAIILLTYSPAKGVELGKIMPLGDSNTRGTIVGGAGPWPAAIGAGGYRYPLQQMLAGAGYQYDFVGSQTTNALGEQGANPPDTWFYDPTFDREHQGLPGYTNNMLLTGGYVPNWPGEEDYAPPLVTALATYQPDIVLLMSGTNGMNPSNVGSNLYWLDQVIRNITASVPNTHVIVSTIFDRWDTTDLYNATQTYNAGIPALVTSAQERGELVTYVDVGGALNYDDFCTNGVLGDGVHPNPIVSNAKEAAVWFEGIREVVPLPEPSVSVMALAGLLTMIMCVYLKGR